MNIKSCGLISGILIGIVYLLNSCSGEKVKESSEKVSHAAGLRVPDGFVIERVVPADLVSYPYFATLDNKGRLFVIESSGKTTSTEDVLKNPTFQIRLLEDLDADGTYEKKYIFADKIPYPMGGIFYQGSFYVTAPPDLLRFTDTDGDGVADKREVILSGWTLSHNAATLSGPFFGPDGWMYMCDARRGFNIQTKEGTELKGKGARIWRCRPDGTGLESVSGGGFDNTIEMIFMPSGETIGTMTYFTDPKDGQRDALMHWVEGGVYPKPLSVIEEDKLKLTGELMPVMTKLPRVSPAGLMRYRGTVFGEAFDGNLFSAQFNTGRIMRHTMVSDGATFRTEDEPFMTSDSLDTHPTDVLQDADGSLIVVNTGGWFIAGCPLSVVAKTDIPGGIFRIRKADAPVVKDPWGRQLDLPSMSATALADMLQDARPAVVDNAFEQLITLGENAVEPLQNLLKSGSREELRAAAVFALYRISTPGAMNGLLSALDDKSVVIRTAAARVLGLAKAKEAVDKLGEMVQKDEAPVRRQAATALGQIGDARGVEPLILASANPDDRFVEHAITYALILLGKTEPMIQALQNSSENMRRTALIVLDQIDGSPLKKNQLAPFLQTKNGVLLKAGIWVASHHPDWSDLIVTFLGARFNGTLSEIEKASTIELMVTFSGSRDVQKFITAQLNSSSSPIANKLCMLEAIQKSPLQKLPEAWVQILGDLLTGEHAVMRAEVLDLLQSRSTPQLNSRLDQILKNRNTPASLRLQAMSAKIMSEPKISDAEFNILAKFAGPDNEFPVRQFAVRLLVQAELTDSQLLTLASEKVRDADTYLLPALVNSFEGSQSVEVGNALITTLLSAQNRLDYLSFPDMQKLVESFPIPVRESAAPLMQTLRQRQATRLTELHEMEAKLKGGDVGEGRKLFFGKALCSTCHTVIENGGDFGPDLTNIGEIRSQHDILEAIVFPSASFAREYETSKVTGNTNTYTGIIKEQLPETIIIETGPGARARIARNEITSITPLSVSLMPPGLHQQLTTLEIADLMSYLTSLPDGLGQLKKEE